MKKSMALNSPITRTAQRRRANSGVCRIHVLMTSDAGCVQKADAGHSKKAVTRGLLPYQQQTRQSVTHGLLGVQNRLERFYGPLELRSVDQRKILIRQYSALTLSGGDFR